VVQPITCSAPRSVADLETPVVDKSWQLSSTVHYDCKEGFIRKGPVAITCQLVDGKREWSENGLTILLSVNYQLNVCVIHLRNVLSS